MTPSIRPAPRANGVAVSSPWSCPSGDCSVTVCPSTGTADRRAAAAADRAPRSARSGRAGHRTPNRRGPRAAADGTAGTSPDSPRRSAAIGPGTPCRTGAPRGRVTVTSVSLSSTGSCRSPANRDPGVFGRINSLRRTASTDVMNRCAEASTRSGRKRLTLWLRGHSAGWRGGAVCERHHYGVEGRILGDSPVRCAASSGHVRGRCRLGPCRGEAQAVPWSCHGHVMVIPWSWRASSQLRVGRGGGRSRSRRVRPAIPSCGRGRPRDRPARHGPAPGRHRRGPTGLG